jgi:hypothetical protein
VASHTVTGATGEGSEAIDGGSFHQVADVYWRITGLTSPRSYLIGTTFPKRARFCGSVQLCGDYPPPDLMTGLLPFISWSINFEWELQPVGYKLSPTFDAVSHVQWKLNPGVTADITVQW